MQEIIQRIQVRYMFAIVGWQSEKAHKIDKTLLFHSSWHALFQQVVGDHACLSAQQEAWLSNLQKNKLNYRKTIQ